MKSSNAHFGLAVAYLLPGFIALAGLAPLFPLVREWLRPMEQSATGGVIAEKELLGVAMTNGNHQAQEAASSEGLKAKTPSPAKKRSPQEPRRPNPSKPAK